MKLHAPEFVQRFDAEPQFWQFLSGLHADDLIVELIQNDLDAKASRTSIAFTPDRLICRGDGEAVSEDGWRRLSFVMGAGAEVESKRFRIGVKNHGLKACFWLGDDIIVRSNGLRVVQTLYKDGHDAEPSPGTFPKPVPDTVSQPNTGCSIEVPYREQELVVSKGEGLKIKVPDRSSLEQLFRNAAESLPRRLLGVVRPDHHDQYTLCLSHHTLGSVEINWRAKRGRHIKGRSRKHYTVFGRECSTSSQTLCIPSTTIYEYACTFRIQFPPESRSEIPDFFFRDRTSFWGEIAWSTDKNGRPKSTKGVRRYPIGYEATSDAALSGVGVNFSGPYRSDAERHGISRTGDLNDYIDDVCKDALVDIVSSYLVHRHTAKAMELFMADPDGAEDESLKDLVERSLRARLLPLADSVSRVSNRSRRITLGPRKTPVGTLRRVVLPMFTWNAKQIVPLLSEICPSEEDQINKHVPGSILRCLVNMDDVITFDENDVVARLQPKLKTEWFPWKNETEWKRTLGNPSIAKAHLDVLWLTISRKELESESEVMKNTYLPDDNSTARPLTGMFSGVGLPPNLGQRDYAPLLHPELQGHRVLKRRSWKPKRFGLDDYLDRAQLEMASLAERRSFWTWLRKNGKTVKPRQTLVRIASLPVWPSTSGSLVPLDDLCEPRSKRATSVMGNALVRPSRELLRVGLASRTGRGLLTIRSTPSLEETELFLAERLDRFPRERKLTADERREFHRLEKDLVDLASSAPRLRAHLIKLAGEYGVALDRDGNLRDPGDLVRDEGALHHLHLLKRHTIDRPKKFLDKLDGWKPQNVPATAQLVDSIREDSDRLDAHVPRIQEYVKQSKRESIEPLGLLDIPCIPVEGELRSPNELALRGSRDFWGDWKMRVSVTDINPEVQRLYRQIGVVGGTPSSTHSRRFFQWLASQNSAIVERHADQVLRHINHERGPSAWSDEFPKVPFIMVELDGVRVRLVTQTDATKKGSRVVIPDFEALESEIRQHRGKRPVEMAIVARPRVTEPATARLRAFGLRALSDYAGEPVEVRGTGRTKATRHFDSRRILNALQSGLTGRQLQKRLAKLDLDAPLRGNWRDRLSRIQGIRTADSIDAIYKLGRSRFSIEVVGELDRESGTLWLRSDSDLQEAFFEVVAGLIFEHPKKYYGSVLERAYTMDMREHDPLIDSNGEPSQEDAGEVEMISQDEESLGPSATSAAHPVPRSDPAINIPNPGPIPQGDEIMVRDITARPQYHRPPSATENAQITDLKENQYAWHCQACLAGSEPKTLAPPSSYVEASENRRKIMEAQHCDHFSAGGARHAGNILLLCHYHHRDLGDAVSRTEITRALHQASPRTLVFNFDREASSPLQGKVVSIQPPQRQTPVVLFFTNEHATYWLTKATEEGLL